MRTKRATGLVLAVALCVSGCTTLRNERRNAGVQEDADLVYLKGELKRLQAQLEGIEAVQQRISNDVEALRASSDRNKQELNGRIAAIEQAMKGIDLSREGDKKEIIKFMQTLATTPSGGQPVAGGVEHVVQAGETLSQIATAYKTKVDVIVKANNLKDAHSLKVGQRLFIPERGPAK